MKIRFAKEADAAELLAIYAPYVKNTAITFEYDVPSVEEFAQRIRSVSSRYPYIAAELDGEIIGYAYASAFHTRAAYDWSVEMSIYLKQEKRRFGIGGKLYDIMEAMLRKQGFLNLNACIAYSDIEDETLTKASVRFHEKRGFSIIGRFSKCGYKFNRWYGMVWMEKHIGEHTTPPPKIIGINDISMQKYIKTLLNEEG